MRNLFIAGVLLAAGALCLIAWSAAPPKSSVPLSPAAMLGKKVFSDRTLSASGKMACATCHDPRYAYGPPNGSAVQYGGPDLKTPGYRAVPSLRYILNYVPVWTHVLPTSPIEQITETDSVPAGGFTWDGRYDTLRAQAMLPFLSPVEMDNRSVEDLARKLSEASYADDFRAIYGRDIFDHPVQAVESATLALEQFELQDPSLHPYTSKFDRWLDGKATLTAQELRGKQLFDDPDNGNCASCHLDELGANGAHPLFTDFQFEALGVPRNNDIPWNADPHYFDLGLCGPFRTDAAAKDATNCGLFRTPTLRNTAIRQVFFHNGRFHTLREALLFYVQRDTNVEKWYPAGHQGKAEKFDDLPPEDRKNVDVIDPPLDRHPGQPPAWTQQNIDDVIAFLKTLDDEDVVEKEDAARTQDDSARISR